MALNSVEEYDTETRGLVLSSAANAYAEQGDVESADAFYNEAISIAVRSGDQAAESVRCGNYGYFLLLIGRPRRAIASLERALRLSQSSGLTLQSAVQTDNLGLSYDALADYEVALDYHRKALAMVETLQQSYWQAVIRINLANTYIALGQLMQAEPLIHQALESGQAGENGEVTIRAQTALALLYVQKGEPAAADAALAAAIGLARRLEIRRWLAEALTVRSQQQSSLRNDTEANSAWEEAQRLYEMLHMPQAKVAPGWLAREKERTED
jgi:tetratricopeptide (TPR) repeat protein